MKTQTYKIVIDIENIELNGCLYGAFATRFANACNPEDAIEVVTRVLMEELVDRGFIGAAECKISIDEAIVWEPTSEIPKVKGFTLYKIGISNEK